MFLLSLPMRRALGMAFVGAGASVLALGTAGIASAASPAAGAREPVTFVVNSIGDERDVTRDGTCLTALKKCTLRAALTEANAAGDRAIINFGMPGTGARVLEIGSALPALTNPAGIVIDGYSQPGTLRNTSPTASNALLKVELKGKGPGTFDGLEILSPNNVVTGISLYNFTNQISIRGNKADNNRIVGSYVCTNAAGTVGSAPMGIQIGIMLQKGASGNVIGSPALGDRNVISGCGNRGVSMAFKPTINNVVQNNIVGLNPSATAALPNRSIGIDINYTSNNTIGGTQPGQGNVISGNGGSGVEVSHTSNTHDNLVAGNLIGVAPSGEATSWSGNALWGIRFEGPKFCGTPGRPFPNGCTAADVSEGLPTNNTARANVIVGNGKSGILIDKGHNKVKVLGNWIGETKSGAAAGNQVAGVEIQRGSFGMLIQGNLLAHNPVGVRISSTGAYPIGIEQRTYNNRITNNRMWDTLGIQFSFASGANMVQNGMAAPALTAAPSRIIKGTTCAGCKVEFYVADGPSRETGKSFLKSVVAKANGSFSTTLSGTKGTPITATSADKTGNTSPFAPAVALRP